MFQSATSPFRARAPKEILVKVFSNRPLAAVVLSLSPSGALDAAFAVAAARGRRQRVLRDGRR